MRSAVDVIEAVREAGGTLTLTHASRVPPDLLADLQRLRAEVKAQVAKEVCVLCNAWVGPTELFCAECWRERGCKHELVRMGDGGAPMCHTCERDVVKRNGKWTVVCPS